MEITDEYTWNDESKDERKNHFLLPNSIRALLVGHSNCGKSTIMNTLLLRPGYLDYQNLLIFGKSLHQMEYQIMKSAFEKGLSKSQIQVIFEHKKLVIEQGGPMRVIENYDGQCKGDITASFFDDDNAIPDPSTLDSKLKHMILFDDCMSGNQAKIGSYFCRGRHNNVNCFYITQSYFKIPRQEIRLNMNFLILFRQSQRDMRQIYTDHVSFDNISFDVFINLFCLQCWDLDPHNFICIDLSRTKDTGKYRRNFSELWFPPIADDVPTNEKHLKDNRNTEGAENGDSSSV